MGIQAGLCYTAYPRVDVLPRYCLLKQSNYNTDNSLFHPAATDGSRRAGQDVGIGDASPLRHPVES